MSYDRVCGEWGQVTATVMSNVDGTAIKEESDFYPWGGEQVIRGRRR